VSFAFVLLLIEPAVTLKVADVEPAATVTDVGALRDELLSDNETDTPPVEATGVRVTVQTLVPPELRLVGLHVSPLSSTGAASEILSVCVLPFSVAVMVAVWLLVIVPAVALKLAVVLLDPTATEAGTVNAVALLDSVTVAPPVCVTVTVQVALLPDPRLAGLQVSPLSSTGAASEIVAVCVLPFSVAVMVAVWLLAIVPAVALKLAVVLLDPTATEAGTVNAAALLDSVTVAPPVFDTVTVQVALPPDPRLAGLHVSPLSSTGATNEIVAVCVLPFSVAVMVAVWLLAIVPVAAVKVAVVLLDPTATEAGTVNAAALLDSVTVAPPVCVTVTVQVALLPDPRLDGLHVSPLSSTGATNETVAVCVLPFSVAVMVAVWLLAIVPVAAVKVAVVLPAPTVTEAGTVNAAVLLDSVTVTPPVGAVELNAMVQVLVAPDCRLVALHCSDSAGATTVRMAV
jgi:hypothetical protein